MLDLSTNVAELSWGTTTKLAFYLNMNDDWMLLLDKLPPVDRLTPAQVDSIGRKPSPAKQLLLELGNRGFVVKSFIKLLDKARLVQPQLVLRRKFVPIKLVKDAQLQRVNDQVFIECLVAAFPYAQYEWLCQPVGSSEPVVCARTPAFSLPFCASCSRAGQYRCRIWNAIPLNADWSADYDRSPPTSSQLHTSTVTLSFGDEKVAPLCDRCRQQLVLQKVGDLSVDAAESSTAAGTGLAVAGAGAPLQPIGTPEQNSKLRAEHKADGDTPPIATDKVALIISNSEYANLSPLTTPPCDAQLLAESLQALEFKTLTVADLSLAEMKRLVNEYTRLMGAGVYAVFYFVGHGFEHLGKCYLLPVDAPGPEDYSCKDCVCVDWILSLTQQFSPALNLLLLDMCRRQPPRSVDHFLSTSEHHEYKLNRNTVFGYATSVRAGAYEVAGESNGIFMKYLKEYVQQPLAVTDMLFNVIADAERDPLAGPEQMPEIRSNLSRRLSLCDPIVYAGHTGSFDRHSTHWQMLHELPDPINVHVAEHGLCVTVWLDYCGHFCNMCFLFTSVTQLPNTDEAPDSGASGLNVIDPINSTHVATCNFPPGLSVAQTIQCNDVEEGVSMRTLVKAIQKLEEDLKLEIVVWNTVNDVELTRQDINFGRVLISRL